MNLYNINLKLTQIGKILIHILIALGKLYWVIELITKIIEFLNVNLILLMIGNQNM